MTKQDADAYLTLMGERNELLGKNSKLEDQIAALLKQAEAMADLFKLQSANRYGAQGYVEEGDIEGLASYWAQETIRLQDMARKALTAWQAFKGEL